MYSRLKTSTSYFIVPDEHTTGALVAETGKNQFFAGHLTQRWLAAICDSPLLTSKGPKPYRVLNSFFNELKEHGLRNRIAYYSALLDDFHKSVSKTTLKDHRVNDEITLEFDRRFLKTPIAKEYISYAKNQNPTLFKYICTVLGFLKKAEFDDKSLQDTAFRGWEATEERLGQLTLQQDDLKWLKLIVSAIINDPDPNSPFMGKHGSGAVAGSERGPFEKSLNFSMDHKLRRVMSPILGIGAMTGDWDALASRSDHKSTNWRDVYSKLMFVAKNYKTMRSICMEPTAYMFFQQHIMFHLVKTLNSSLAGLFIKIHDQTRNQEGAIYGSRTGLVDTIDLSAASDSIHINLIRGIFPRRWLHPLLASRTSKVLCPDKSIRVVNKFAPMGSALCFPVQSITFTAVVIYAYLRHHLHLDISDVETPASLGINTDYVRRFVLKHISKNFGYMSAQYESIGVYGDDIICDFRTSHIVISLLNRLGFMPNVSKSFYNDDALRESCGIYAINGVDVTPFKYKCKYLSDDPMGASEFARMIQSANNAGDHGLKTVRSNIIRFVLNHKPPRGRKVNPVIFSDNKDHNFTIYSTNPRNVHLKHRVVGPDVDSDDDVYRHHYVNGWGLTSQSEDISKRPLDEIQKWDLYELHMWNRSTLLRGETYFCTPRKVSRGTKIRWQWLAA